MNTAGQSVRKAEAQAPEQILSRPSLLDFEAAQRKRIVDLEAMLRELVATFHPKPNPANPPTIWDRAAALLLQD